MIVTRGFGVDSSGGSIVGYGYTIWYNIVTDRFIVLSSEIMTRMVEVSAS